MAADARTGPDLIVPGLWSLAVPIPESPLGHTFCYVLASDRGPVLVDPGWNSDEALDTIRDGLRQIGSDIHLVSRIVLTHHHRDHAGIAGAIQRESGCTVAIHDDDADAVRDPSGILASLAPERLRLDGTPDGEISAMRAAARRWSDHPLVIPDLVSLEDGEVDIPGWHATSVWTPGHTPGHTCLRLELEAGFVLLTGDHILPRITPNVGLASTSNADPLGDYEASLARIRSLGEPVRVLPAHEWAFQGLAARIDEIRAHHHRRLDDVRARLGERGPSTAWELASSLYWSRRWDSLPPLGHRAALNETRAHLARLVLDGQVASDHGEPVRYALTRGAEAAGC